MLTSSPAARAAPPPDTIATASASSGSSSRDTRGRYQAARTPATADRRTLMLSHLDDRRPPFGGPRGTAWLALPASATSCSVLGQSSRSDRRSPPFTLLPEIRRRDRRRRSPR